MESGFQVATSPWKGGRGGEPPLGAGSVGHQAQGGGCLGPTGCDPGHSSLVTGCAEEDKEVDELGEEEDEEPPELYSGDVSSAVKRGRRPARGVTPSRAYYCKTNYRRRKVFSTPRP